MSEPLAIIGASAAETARAEGFDGRIRPISAAERHPPYDRPALSELLADTGSDLRRVQVSKENTPWAG